MNPEHFTRRRSPATLLLLSGVLVLGIVQWSFLPILIQNGPVTSIAVLEMTAGHSSKFAAPFKCLFGDGFNPCLLQTGIITRNIATRMPYPPETSVSGNEDRYLSSCPLRAPPAA
jgi:hypothetical protein